jgi:hypothetical protein
MQQLDLKFILQESGPMYKVGSAVVSCKVREGVGEAHSAIFLALTLL